MTANQDPDIEYHEDGGVTITAPKLQLFGMFKDLVGGEAGDDVISPYPEAEPDYQALYPEDGITPTVITGGTDGWYPQVEYRGDLSDEEFEALPFYFRRQVVYNGLSSASIRSSDDAAKTSDMICLLLNRGYEVGKFTFLPVKKGARIVFPFSKTTTEYAEKALPNLWFTEVPSEVLEAQTKVQCCGNNPTVRVVQAPAVHVPINIANIAQPFDDDDAYGQRGRPIDYVNEAERAWGTSFTRINRD